MSVVLKEESAAAVPTPATGKQAIFFDTSDGYFKKKDDTGAVTLLEDPIASNALTALTGDVVATGPGSVPVTLANAVITGKLLTGLVSVSGAPLATDSILTAIGKLAGSGLLTPRTVNADTTIPTGYVWIRPSETLFSGLTTITLQGDSELRFI